MKKLRFSSCKSFTYPLPLAPQQLNGLIRTRRGVFAPQLEPGKIIPDLLWQLLENASRAPSHQRPEPGRCTVLAGVGLRKPADFQASL